MRLFFLAVMLFFFVTVKSQTVLSRGFGMYPQSTSLLGNYHLHDSDAPKWFLSSYSGLATSISFFKGDHASIFSAPIGLQLNRTLSNNWFAFANVTAAPSYISINPSYLSGLNKNFYSNSVQQNHFGLYPAASLGLMYVNDARTFSISGSVSAERNVYPLLPYQPLNRATQSPVLSPRR